MRHILQVWRRQVERIAEKPSIETNVVRKKRHGQSHAHEPNSFEDNAPNDPGLVDIPACAMWAKDSWMCKRKQWGEKPSSTLREGPLHKK